MDIDQRIDTLEQRLSSMERKSRAWRILALLLFVTLIGCLQSEDLPVNTSQAADEETPKEKVAKFDVIEANVVRVVDPKGEALSELSPGRLGLMTADKKAYISLSVTKVTPSNYYLSTIHVVTPKGPQNGQSTVTLNQREGSEMHLTSHGLHVSNAKHVQEFRKLAVKGSRVTEAENQRMDELTNRDIEIEVSPRGGGAIRIHNTFQKPVVEIQSNKTNQGAIYLGDVNGKTVRSLSAP